MAQWLKVQCLPSDSVQLLYNQEGFPVVIRHHFSQWIEDQNWFAYDENDEEADVYIKEILSTLLRKMHEGSEQTNDFILKLEFERHLINFRKMYSKDPKALFRIIKNCLTLEQKLLKAAESPTMTSSTTEVVPAYSRSNTHLIMQSITNVQQISQEMDSKIKELQRNQELIVLCHQERVKLDAETKLCSPTDLLTQSHLELIAKWKDEKLQLEEKLKNMLRSIETLRYTILKKLEQCVLITKDLFSKVLNEELKLWKQQQKLASDVMLNENTSLMTIQHWCEALADILWQNHQHIKLFDRLLIQFKMEHPHETTVRELDSTISSHIVHLIKSCFIVETQPPQVLKKDSRFSSSIRLLVGSKLNMNMNLPPVKVYIINETQARAVSRQDHSMLQYTSGEILNNNGHMEYDQITGQLGITFRNMQLKKIKRSDRKGSESVTEEKFCLLFHSDIKLAEDLSFSATALSLPVVVTVHGNQECNAQATILWDNTFSDETRSPFDVPEVVPWPRLADLLSVKFKQATNRCLSNENLSYLHSKLFDNESYENSNISWTQFNKEQLMGRNFTFWEWFYAILKLTKEHLRGPWNEGSIVGFISKDVAQKFLLSHPNGTFILRFSDSLIGGITIAWVGDDPVNIGMRTVFNLAPYTAKDFAIRGLGDRIKDLDHLTILYPDVPKNVAFLKYYSTNSSEIGGYIKTELVETVVNIPQTPSHLINYDGSVAHRASPLSSSSNDSHASPLSSNLSPGNRLYDWLQQSHDTGMLTPNNQPQIQNMDSDEQEHLEYMMNTYNTEINFNYNSDDINLINVTGFIPS